MRRRRSASMLALVLAVVLAGGHAAGLQVVAWTSMLIAFAQTQDLGTAAASTFDGEHPCALCLAARNLRDAGPDAAAPAGKTDPAKTPAKKTEKKPDLMGICLHAWRRPGGPIQGMLAGAAGAVPRGRSPQPATPPPLG